MPTMGCEYMRDSLNFAATLAPLFLNYTLVAGGVHYVAHANNHDQLHVLTRADADHFTLVGRS